MVANARGFNHTLCGVTNRPNLNGISYFPTWGKQLASFLQQGEGGTALFWCQPMAGPVALVGGGG